MIRISTTIKRSTIVAASSTLSPSKLRQRNDSSNLITARSLNTYHHPFPYYGDPAGSFQADPTPRRYAHRFGHHLSPDCGPFHPGVKGRDPRLGFQFRGEYSPYPVGLFCRCCGCQQFVVVNYGGNQGWNPNVGGYWGVVVQGNGFVDRGIGYDGGCGWSQTRGDYIRNNTVGGGGSFDGRSIGYENSNRPYGENVSNFMRNPNEAWGRDTSVIDPNVAQQRKDSGVVDNERRRGHQITGVEEQKIAHEGYRWPQDGFRWRNNNFVENEGRDRNFWSQSRNTGNGYGPEQSVHRGNGYMDQKNGNASWDLAKSVYDGGRIGGQPQNLTVDERRMNSNAVSGGYRQTTQSPRIFDGRGNDSNPGSDERNWSVNLQSGSDYSQAGVRGSHQHENLNRAYNENLIGFQPNTKKLHGQEFNVNRNNGFYQSFNAPYSGEGGPVFQENKVVKQDTGNVSYDQTKDMRNIYDPLPRFVGDEQPASPNRISAQNNQMQNVNDKGSDGVSLPPAKVLDVAHDSKDAAGRCQRIINILENEDNHRSKESDSGIVPQSRNGCTTNPVSLSKGGESVDAKAMFSDMSDQGVTPFNTLVDALAKMQKCKEAKELLLLMKERGGMPDVGTYNSLMECFFREGNIKELEEVFCSMERDGVKANVESYNIMIKGYEKHGMLDDATKVHRRMFQKGVRPSEIPIGTPASKGGEGRLEL
uniref:Pentatricopeptide repeat-containing protein n=1 Tax=Kalanchoe fedtschenkoi TaxID=63787 RepID=A0A7N0UTF6_KALFE